MILVSYDGSADARAAIDCVSRVMPGAGVTVVTVWEPFVTTMTRRAPFGIGMVGAYDDSEQIDAGSEHAALACATEGAERARAAGLDAHPRAAALRVDIATTILDVAAELDVDLVAVGTRGRGSVTAFVLGSVSHAVAQHAGRAVLIVPAEPVHDVPAPISSHPARQGA